jgi:hypothetical protein
MIKSRSMKWVGMRNVHKILVERPEGKRVLRSSRHKWEDNVTMDLWEVGLRVWIGLVWLRIGTGSNFCEHGSESLVPKNVKNFLTR